MFYIMYVIYVLYSFELTLSVCVWRWFCNSLHESIWCYKWCRGCTCDGV